MPCSPFEVEGQLYIIWKDALQEGLKLALALVLPAMYRLFLHEISKHKQTMISRKIHEKVSSVHTDRVFYKSSTLRQFPKFSVPKSDFACERKTKQNSKFFFFRKKNTPASVDKATGLSTGLSFGVKGILFTFFLPSWLNLCLVLEWSPTQFLWANRLLLVSPSWSSACRFWWLLQPEYCGPISENSPFLLIKNCTWVASLRHTHKGYIGRLGK